MAVADKIIALLDTMTLASLDSLPPVRRRQFADLCRHWADIAEQQRAAASSGPRGELPIESVPAKPPAKDAEL